MSISAVDDVVYMREPAGWDNERSAHGAAARRSAQECRQHGNRLCGSARCRRHRIAGNQVGETDLMIAGGVEHVAGALRDAGGHGVPPSCSTPPSAGDS